ncbi:MAG: phage holin family protein [Sphingobacteriales bacterium]|nr:MAG: phage holin family protein [Sphingobacteriales bacterium]
MKDFIVALLVNGLLVYVLGLLLPGISINSFFTAVCVGFVMGVINYFVKPILATLTLPLTILTFGLFLLVLNGALVMLAGYIVDGFSINGMIPAILFAILFSMTNTMFGIPKVIGK